MQVDLGNVLQAEVSPRETILLLHVLVSVQSDCYDLTLNQPEPIARLGPEQELSI